MNGKELGAQLVQRGTEMTGFGGADAVWTAHPGLTKRELLSAMAMQGCLSNDHPAPKYWADACVKMADELLDALAKDVQP